MTTLATGLAWRFATFGERYGIGARAQRVVISVAHERR